MSEKDRDIVIDPRFFRPPNVVDLRGKNQEDGSSFYDILPGDNTDPSQGDDDVTAEVPMPPTSFELVSQSVRKTSSGTTVVDVTLELPDILGVREYEVRVAKTE